MWASYARVSDPRPEEKKTKIGLDRYGLERQDRANERYIRQQDFTGDIAKFRDRISGTTETREHFEALLSAVRDRTVQHVCIPEVDRLARDEFVAATLIFELWAAGATVHDANRNRIIDRNNAQSRREFFQDAIEASSERERIVRRMYAGKLEKIRDGKPERPLNAFGWRAGQIDSEEADLVRWMYRRALEAGVFRVSQELNERGITSRRDLPWQNSSVRVILTNPIYKGVYEFGKQGERLTLEIPPIIEPELWERVQVALQKRHKGQRTSFSRQAEYPLMGRIRCAECGGAMTPFQPRETQHRYYFCRNTLVRTNKRCTHNRYYQSNKLETAVLAMLQSLKSDQATLEAALSAPTAPDISVERNRLTKRLERAKAAYEAGVDTLEEYSQTKKRTLEQLTALEQQSTTKPREVSTALAELEAALRHSDLAEIARGCNLLVLVARDESIRLELQ